MSTMLTRRALLKMGALASGAILAACQPAVVKETVVVEKEVEKVVKETVVVEKEKIVEKDVAAEKAAALKGKLVWDTFRGVGTGWNEERITTFKDIYPNVEVKLRPGVMAGQQENYGKWYAMYAAGDLGDITQFDPSHYHFWRAIDKGIVMPITEFVNEENLDLKQWFDAFIEMQWYKGDIYGLPSWGWTGYDCFVTNYLHFEEAGLEPPEPTSHEYSMDQIAQWAHDFYKPGKGPGEVERYGLALSWGEAGVVVLTRAFGGYLINEEGTKCLLLEEKPAQAMKWAYKLAVEDQILPAPGELSGGNQGAWAAGKLTMYHGGSLSVINANKAITDKSLAKIGQVLFPTREDGKIPSQLRGGTWDVTSTTKYPRAAYEFIKHLSGKDGTIGFNLIGGNGALTRPDVLPVLAANNPLYNWFYDNLENGMGIRAPANSRGREYTDAVAQWCTKLMDKENPIPFEQGLQEMHDAIQKVLDMEPF